MDNDQTLQEYARFNEEVERIKAQYADTKDPETITSGVRALASRRNWHPFVDFLIRLGESCIEGDDYQAGITWIMAAGKYFPNVFNKTVYYLRMAQYHFENGDRETGLDYLTKLCKTYGPSTDTLIGLQGMNAVWEPYRHLVEDLLPEPADDTPQPEENAAPSIADILNGPDDDLLTDLSTHLNEICDSGDYLNALNKWERTVWYADELCMEVNSGGFEGYLYYHGTHFEKAYKAIADMGAPNVIALLDAVRAKFPKNRIPKSEEAIQNAMDKLEDNGVGFEDQDDAYYSGLERELLSAMTAYVRANAKRFR